MHQEMASLYHASYGNVDRSLAIAQNTGTANLHVNNTYNSAPQAWGRDECLQALAFTDMDRRMLDVKPGTAGTCTWIYQDESYRSWLEAKGILWLKGKPGAGKSTIMKSLVDALVGSQQPQSDTIFFSFFFHGRGSPLQKSPMGLYRSVLHQILDKESNHVLISDFLKQFECRVRSSGLPGDKLDWHESELQTCLERYFSKLLETRSILLFLDALDECGRVAATELVRFCQKLRHTASSAQRNLAICISCRPYPHIFNEDDFNFTTCVEHNNEGDIGKYVEATLLRAPLGSKEKDTLRGSLLRKAQGVFQWVVLVAERLMMMPGEGKGTKAMLRDMSNIPEGLTNLYREMMDELYPDDLPIALRMMQWICCSRRSLRLAEIRFALCIDPGNAYSRLSDIASSEEFAENYVLLKLRVKALSRGLAEVVETGASQENQQVQLVHDSVKEFMITSGLHQLEARLNLNHCSGYSNNGVGRAHLALSRCCVLYIGAYDAQSSRLEGTEHVDGPSGISPEECSAEHLLDYAVEYWYDHAKSAEGMQVSLASLAATFQWPSDRIVQSWTQLHNNSKHLSLRGRFPRSRFHLEHVACYFGLSSLLQEVLQYDGQAQVNEPDGHFRTPLCYAAEEGHDATVKVLLNSEKVDTRSELRLTTHDPVELAATRKQTSTLRLLLDAEVRTNFCRTDGSVDAIKLAALSVDPKTCRDILAICNFDKASLFDLDESHALADAVAIGSTGLVEAFLEMGPHPRAFRDGGHSLVVESTQTGFAEITKLLIQAGALVECIGTESPLEIAASRGNGTIVGILLSGGARADFAPYHDAQTPLGMALAHGHIYVTRQLLDMGASLSNVVFDTDHNGDTVLTRAARSGNDALVRFLLEHCSEKAVLNMHYVNKYGETALMRAIDSKSVDTVRLLLEAGSDVRHIDTSGNSVLLRAIVSHSVDIVRLLLEAGSDTLHVDAKGNSVLLQAIGSKPDDNIRVLPEADSDLYYLRDVGADGKLPPMRATISGNINIVRLLLESSPYLLHVGAGGIAAVMRAIELQNMDIVRLLLEISPDLLNVDADGVAAVVRATELGNLNIVRLLLELRPWILYTGSDGGSALIRAIELGKVDVVRLLLEVSPRMLFAGPDGASALIRASESGMIEVVRLLLDAGIDLDYRDRTGNTALSAAVRARSTAVVEMLLQAGSDISCTNEKGMQALHLAAYISPDEAVDSSGATVFDTLLMFCKDPDLSVKDCLGNTPLHYAADRSATTIVASLLADGASSSPVNYNGNTPLHLAIMPELLEISEPIISGLLAVNVRRPFVKYGLDTHHSERWRINMIIQTLLAAGANISVENNKGETPLFCAVKQNNEAAVATLLTAGADHSIVSKDGFTPLYLAVELGNENIVTSLLTAGADPSLANKDGVTPLHCAVDLGCEDIVSTLLAAGADPSLANKSGDLPLSLAVRLENETIVTTLLTAGADPSLANRLGNTPLHHAADCNYHGIATSLLAAGADHPPRNLHGVTPLHYAAKTDSSIVTILLAAGADPSVKNNNGETPLFYAASKNAEANVAILLAAGADAAIVDHKYGNTPLHVLARQEATADNSMVDGCRDVHLDCVAVHKAKNIVESLIKADLNASVKNKNGTTPLHFAAMRNSATVTILLAAGAQPSLSDEYGYTPLHYVAITTANAGTKRTIANLIAAGANPLKRDDWGRRPSEYALQVALEDEGSETMKEKDLPAGWLETIELLRTAEANAIGTFSDDSYDDDDKDEGEDEDQNDEENEDGGEDVKDDRLEEEEEEEDEGREKTSNDGDEHEDNQGDCEEVEEEEKQISQNEDYSSNHDDGEPQVIPHASQTRKRRDRQSMGSQPSQLAGMTITKRPRVIEIEDD